MSDILEGKSRYSLSDYRQKELDHFEAQPIKQSCSLCGWEFEGTVLEARAAAAKHREKKHPETLNLPRVRRRSARALHSFRYSSMDSESIAEIQAERKKRAYLNGVDLDSQT